MPPPSSALSLQVTIAGVKLEAKNNYFVVLTLDKGALDGSQEQTGKQRTEVCKEITNVPQFKKVIVIPCVHKQILRVLAFSRCVLRECVCVAGLSRTLRTSRLT